MLLLALAPLLALALALLTLPFMLVGAGVALLGALLLAINEQAIRRLQCGRDC